MTPRFNGAQSRPAPPREGRPRAALARSARLPSATLASLLSVLTALGVSACGGGGGDAGVPLAPPTATTTAVDYPSSVVPGPAAQSLRYTPGSGTALASVSAAAASPLLPAGTTPLIAEHLDARLPGLRVACISGHGDSTNVVSGINLGVIAESAAVLLDTRWKPVDAAAAWAMAVAQGSSWSGWENCGVKPEGSPSPSSTLLPTPDGGYAEDVYDGNPGTTFNVVSQRFSSSDVAAMLGAGLATRNDPQRPLRLTLGAYTDGAGHTIFIESGVAASGAAASVRGFIALYLPP